MALTPGTRLGPYEVLTQIGVGGMGEVYRATDTNLKRQVAIKVLPASVAGDADRLARFQREAEVLAALNHPNIAAIHGLEDAGGVKALVMELVEGEDLSQVIARRAGPSGPAGRPLDEALPIAKQIAEALEAAHEQGIIHRDLKPANIKVRPDGTVKVLDFGLAKAMDAVGSGQSAGGSAPVSQAPTITTPAMMTGVGMILGTAAYMSPEQARGKAVDKRADIWAFGAVLFEMLTGHRAFTGDDVTDTIVSVISKEPDWAALPPSTSVAVRSLLQRCLDKDPKRRLRDVGEARMTLESAKADPVGATGPDGVHAPRPWPLVAAIAVVAALLGGAVTWALRPSESGQNAPVAHVEVVLPDGDTIGLSLDGPTLALSPDGTTLVYVGVHDNQQQLFVRPLNSLDAAAIPGTDGAALPFFSPDGQWIGFFAQGKLKKTAVAGGGVQVLADAPQGRGGTWAPDDTIYFAPTASTLRGLVRVSASGGAVTEVTTLDGVQGEVSHRWPQILPGGKALLFSVRAGTGDGEWRVEALILETGERRVLAQNADTGRYVPTGHLVYASYGSDVLMAVPMNLDRVEVATSAPVVLTAKVRLGGEGAHFAVSDAGHVVYVRGGEQRRSRRLVWVDRQGRVETVSAPIREYRATALSPDGRLAAVEAGGTTNEIWIYDFNRRTMSKLNTGGQSQAPVWSPDGTHVAYRATREGSRNIFWKAVDNADPEERLTTTGGPTQIPGSFSPDGLLLAFSGSALTTGADLWVLSMVSDKGLGDKGRPETAEERAARSVLVSPVDERSPQLSPDGRWLAYASNESGRMEIYVQLFPAMDRKWLVSTDGGIEPRWSRNGRELFYRSGDKFMAVDVTAQPAFSAGSPRMLFQGHGVPTNTNSTGYDTSLDGQRFLMVEPVEAQAPVTQVEVVMNWFEELKRLVPAK
ncbi:MAG: protein kinase [Vicinamibacterales bacterium]